MAVDTQDVSKLDVQPGELPEKMAAWVIRQERENLLQAQAEWRERIGQAEIDISVERAKIARERMELEEKLRNYQSEQVSRPAEGSTAAPEKPARGRWLARLGLKDLNDE